MLSPRKAPIAPAAMTSASCWLPSPAATPPMITVVSLGTIGTTESKKAMTRMTTRNHQWPEMSFSQSERSVTIPATSTPVIGPEASDREMTSLGAAGSAEAQA